MNSEREKFTFSNSASEKSACAILAFVTFKGPIRTTCQPTKCRPWKHHLGLNLAKRPLGLHCRACQMRIKCLPCDIVARYSCVCCRLLCTFHGLPSFFATRIEKRNYGNQNSQFPNIF